MSNERPILFKDEMIRAILEGRKTQTRRIVKPCKCKDSLCELAPHEIAGEINRGHYRNCPYGQPGDRLWVREAHAFVPMPAYRCSTGIYQKINPSDDYEACVYRENFDRARSFPWRPSIHMPRWASRITLEITGIRVERLQDISEKDAEAEGARFELAEIDSVRLGAEASHRGGFQNLWRRINGNDSWDANPWVWVVEFKCVDQKGV